MKHCRILMVAALASTSGCINWSAADASWCNTARLNTMHGVCGAPDTTIAGNVGEILGSATLGGEADDGVNAAAGTSGGSFVAGTVGGPATFGTAAIDFRGGTDGYVARIGDDGQPTAVRFFGGPGDDRAADLIAGDGADLFLAANFAGSIEGPNGQSVGTAASTDAFIARLDGELNVGALATLGGASGSDARIAELAWADGQLAVVLQFRGTYTFEGHLLEAPGADYQLATLVLDRDLHYLWHAATTGCKDLLADSVGLGTGGALYLAARYRADTTASCQLLGQPLSAGSRYYDLIARVDPNAGAPSLRWSNQWISPRDYVDGAGHRPETPTSLAVRGDQVQWSHGERLSFRPSDYFWNLHQIDPDDGTAIEPPVRLGSLGTFEPSQHLIAKVSLDADGALWAFGSFIGDKMALPPFENGGQFFHARNGFVVKYAPDPADSWARVMIGNTSSRGTTVVDVVRVPGRPTMLAGSYDTVTIASDTYIDTKGLKDGFVLMLEPEHPASMSQP